MKNPKKILIIVSLIIMAIIRKDKNNSKNDPGEEPYDYEFADENVKVLTFSEYKIIKNCLQGYIDMLNTENSRYYQRNENGEFVKNINENEFKSNIMDVLDKDYIESENITTANLYDYINTIDENKMVLPIEIKKGKETENLFEYKTVVLLVNTNKIEEGEYLYAEISIDKQNNSYSIRPLKNEDELDKYSFKSDLNTIVANENNQYIEYEITDEEAVKDYFSMYKYILLSDSELAYEYLDSEYRNLRFKNIEDFKTYIKNTKTRISQMRVTKYEVNYDNENGIQYICENQFGDIFIFNEESTLNYKVILDEYTIDLPQFIAAYDKASDKEKITLNIAKVVQALNAGDYEYMYNKLNEKFRTNNYATLDEFEEYLKDKLPENIKVEYGNFSNEGETYIYELNITDLLGKSEEKVTMEIIMKLKDNRDFQIAFNIK